MNDNQLEHLRFNTNTAKISCQRLIQEDNALPPALACTGPQKDNRINNILEEEVFEWFDKKGVKIGNIENLHVIYTENQRDKVREVTKTQKVQFELKGSLMKRR